MKPRQRLTTPSGTPLVWLLAITYKRRKGKPREYIAVCNGGVLHILFFHQQLYKSMKVPGSWIDFKLHKPSEFKKLAPTLYAEWIRKLKTPVPAPERAA